MKIYLNRNIVEFRGKLQIFFCVYFIYLNRNIVEFRELSHHFTSFNLNILIET